MGSKIYLFPNMMDQYQIQLTRMLETDHYEEAKQLLRFLLQCEGQEKHQEEWQQLLHWLEAAFPGETVTLAEDNDEAFMREQVLTTEGQDDDYIEQVLQIIRTHPALEQQQLALERAVYLDGEKVDKEIIAWLSGGGSIHPVIQFKGLQCLRRRGTLEMVKLERGGEVVELDPQETPLQLEDYPAPLLAILDKTVHAAEIEDATLPHFAKDLWGEYLQYIYGTAEYEHLAESGEYHQLCYAAALHYFLLLAMQGRADTAYIKEVYDLDETHRLGFEQACQMFKKTLGSLHSKED